MTQKKSAEAIAATLTAEGLGAEVALVLGSGWNGVTDFLEERRAVSYASAGMPPCGVEGHAGNFVFGRIGGKKIVALQGRFHYYEGRPMSEIVLPVNVLARIGVHTLILTNSAGGIREDLVPGDLMVIRDHINFTGQNPLIGVKAEKDRPVFIDLSTLYDEALSEKFFSLAKAQGLGVHEGVYAQLTGPSYETPAEIRMLRMAGADAVGMSTALEAIYAKYLGLRVAAVSCISNMAAGVTQSGLSHAEVLSTLARVQGGLSSLMRAFLCECV